jgi:hypothetical protein
MRIKRDRFFDPQLPGRIKYQSLKTLGAVINGQNEIFGAHSMQTTGVMAYRSFKI